MPKVSAESKARQEAEERVWTAVHFAAVLSASAGVVTDLASTQEAKMAADQAIAYADHLVERLKTTRSDYRRLLNKVLEK